MEQFANIVQGCVSLLSRFMLVAIFLFSAFDSKIRHFSQTAEYMRSEGIPNPRLALFGAIGLILLGGLSLLAGAWTRIGAAFLLVFLAAATFYFHDFWMITDPVQRQLQVIQFMKNMAIGGGLLALIYAGGGPWSVDGWIDRKLEESDTAPPPSKGSSRSKAA
jgi:putative oxidoreductase